MIVSRYLIRSTSACSVHSSKYLRKSFSSCSINNLVVSQNSHLFPSQLSNSKYGRFETARCMTTAYDGEPGLGVDGLDKIPYLPISAQLQSGSKVEVSPFREEEWQIGMDLMNLIIREGRTWPFENEFNSMDAYRGYFLSHAAFVVRALEPGVDGKGDTYEAGEIMGCFYIKPNFPGRCSHICNGGFITTPRFREMGVATLMGRSFIKLAGDLGYKSSYFNLVFKSNEASVNLWESLGFERVAVLENAADLEGVDGLDTAYGYRYNLEKVPSDYQILNPERTDSERKQDLSTSSNDSSSTTDYAMKEIGIISSPYPQRAGCPRQGLLAMSSRSILTLHDDIAKECLDGLEEYSHVWVIFQFHLNPIGKGRDKNAARNHSQGDRSPPKFTASKVKPPRAGGKKVGVLATRSPHRPNNIGISLAMVEEVTTINVVGAKNKIHKKTIVKLKGLDVVEGTPVYDLKPYLPSDIVPKEMLKTPSWVSADDQLSAVEWSVEARNNVQKCQRSGLLEPLYSAKIEQENDEIINAISEIVSQDPRAQHEGRGHDTHEMSTYAITFSTLRVKFQVTSSMGEKAALILEVVPDEGDISAQPGSYQHSVGMRRNAEAESLEKGLNLTWKYPVREGVTSDLFKLRDGSTHKYGTEKC